MTLKYLVDTNVISEPLRPQPRHSVVRKLRLHEEEIAIASVVWHELRFGVERLPLSQGRIAFERYLDLAVSAIAILGYDRTAAEWHARERARLVSRGETPPFADGQIAAIAFVNDLALVTFNTADFKRFQGLRVLNWQ